MDVKELESKIKEYSEKYYLGKDTITDAEFDNLVDKLRELDPNNELLRTTGWGFSIHGGDRKVRHPLVNVGGLNKVKTTPESILNFKSATPKYDGASIELIYESGALRSAITRGDGEYGQESIHHLLPVVGTLLDISSLNQDEMEFIRTSTISISGEFILSKESFKNNYPDEISYRNIPSGFLNRNDSTPEECRRFSFIPYRINSVICDSESIDYVKSNLNNRSGIQNLLNSVFNIKVPFILDSNDRSYEDLMKEFSEKSDYNFDGIVVNKYNKIMHNITKSDKSDSSVKIDFIYDELAYKVVTDTEDVVVTHIDWNLTRTGRYIPVIEFDPVELSGAMIHRATGHNFKNLLDNGIDVGATIKITRSGEVIPYVLEVLNPVDVRRDYVCPECGTPLVVDGVDLVCNNPDCKAKRYQQIYQWITYLGEVKGAGSSLYNTILEYGKIESIYDFYSNNKVINWHGIVDQEGVGYSKLDIVLEIIEKLHQPMKFYWILVASNIKGISTSNAKKLQNETNLRECIENNTPDKFSIDNAKGLGWSVKKSILDNWELLLDNFSYVELSEENNQEINQEDLSNKLKICVTGKFEYGTRSKLFEDFKDKIEEVDIKNAEYLVTNNPNSGSSKNKRALELGVKVITELQLMELIGEKINNKKE